METKKKRFLAILLTLAMVLGLMSGMTLTAYADDWDGDIHFTTDAEYDDFIQIEKNIKLTIDEGVTVTINGEVFTWGTLIVKGKGKLIIKGSDSDSVDLSTGGTGFQGNILIDGPEVTITGGKGFDVSDDPDSSDEGGKGGAGVIGNVIVKSGSVNVTGGQGGKGNQYIDNGGEGISNGNLIVNGGSATVNGGPGGWDWNGGSIAVLSDVIVRSGSAVLTGGGGGFALLGTITGDAVESDNNTYWNSVSDHESLCRYVKVNGNVPLVEYPLWVGGVQVTNYNQDDVLDDDPVNIGKVSYTPATTGETPTPATLTLSGANITTGCLDSNSLMYGGIIYEGSTPLTIELASGTNNTVDVSESDKGDYNCGISCFDKNASPVNLTITGEGSMTAKGKFAGITASDITINNGVVEAKAVDDDSSAIRATKSVTINGGTVTASGDGTDSIGIYAMNNAVTISGGKVIATGSGKAIDGTVKNAIAGTGWTNVEGTQGKADIAKSETGQNLSYKKVQFPAIYPLWVGGTQVTSANAGNIDGNNKASYDATTNTLTLDGYQSTMNTGAGIEYTGQSGETSTIVLKGSNSIVTGGDGILINSGDLVIRDGGSGGSIEVEGGNYPKKGIYANGKLTIEGGTITARAGDCGIKATDLMTVQGGTVTGDGNSAIIASKGLTVQGGTVTANAVYYGIQVNDGSGLTVEGGTVEAIATDASGTGVYSYNNKNCIIGSGVTSFTASGGSKAMQCPVKNAIDGTGWTNTDGTEGEAKIEVSESGQDLSSYKRVQFPPNHTHEFTYSAKGATITATCTAEDCRLPPSSEGGTDHVATLTIAAPTLKTYGQTGEGISAEAKITDADSIKGDATVKYYKATKSGSDYEKSGEALAAAPADADDYVAEITLGSETNTATASVGYTIAQKPVTVSGITASGKIYDGTTEATLVTTEASFDGKLDSDTLTVTATGAFADKNVGENKTVAITGLTLDGADKDNYTLATDGQQTTATANITAKEVGLTWSNTELTYNGEAQKPTATATGLEDEDTCTVTVTGEQTNVGENYTATAESLSNSNYKLPENKTTAFKITKADAVAAAVTANNRTYDGTEKPLVTVAGEATGGEMQYALGMKDAATDEYTTSIPTATDAGTYYVWYKVAGDTNHADSAAKYVKATVAKADPVVDNPGPLSGTQGDLLESVKLPSVSGGTWSWAADPGAKLEQAGECYFDAAFTPGDTDNYTTIAGVAVLVNVTAAPTPAAKTSIAKAKVTLAKKSFTYDGKAKKPKVTSVTLAGKKLKAGTDYSVKYASNVKPGKATVTVTGKGAYKDTAKATFTIALAKAKLSTDADIKAKAMGLAWAKVPGAKSYQVQWRERGGKWKSKTVKSSKATVKATISGMKAGKLYDYRVRAVAGDSKGAWSAERHRWFVRQAGVAATSKKSGSVKVTWDKTAKADAGYLVTVRYSRDGEAVAKKAVAAGKTSATITGLAPGKTAWVHVRAIRSAGGASYPGALTYSTKSVVKVAGSTTKAKAKAQSVGTQTAGGALAALSI